MPRWHRWNRDRRYHFRPTNSGRPGTLKRFGFQHAESPYRKYPSLAGHHEWLLWSRPLLRKAEQGISDLTSGLVLITLLYRRSHRTSRPGDSGEAKGGWRIRSTRRLQVDDVAGCFVTCRDEAETKALVKANARAVLHVDDRPNGLTAMLARQLSHLL
jgi:hypothetical protein